MFRLVDPRPVNVIRRALPIPPPKVTELEPLPVHPAQVKIPDVENVTGSALASDVPSETIARSNALIRVTLKTLAMSAPFVCLDRAFRTASNEGTPSRGLNSTRLKLMTLTAAGQKQPLKTCFYG